MNIHCVAIDDEPLALNLLDGYIQQVSFLELDEKFTNPVKAFQYLNEHETDLVFLDIQMPDLTGLELISKILTKPMFIFTTAYSHYALEGFKADAIDYLLKPIDFPDFLKSVTKAHELFNLRKDYHSEVKSNEEFLFIKSEYKLIRINFQDILYIQGMSEYVQIHLAHGKPVMSLLSLKMLETKLPEHLFMRVHKSYIVNLKRINVIERNEILYENGTVIPVSQQYKAKFQQFIDQNFMD